MDGDGVFEPFSRARGPVARFAAGGGYPVHARVTDDHGLTSTASRTLNVIGPGQTAPFTILTADGTRGRLVAGEPLKVVAEAVKPSPARSVRLRRRWQLRVRSGRGDVVHAGFRRRRHTDRLQTTDADGGVYTSRVRISVAPAGDQTAPWISQEAPGRGGRRPSRAAELGVRLGAGTAHRPVGCRRRRPVRRCAGARRRRLRLAVRRSRHDRREGHGRQRALGPQHRKRDAGGRVGIQADLDL